MCYVPLKALDPLQCHQRKYEMPMVVGFLAESYGNLTGGLDITVTPYVHIFWRLKLSQLGHEKSKKWIKNNLEKIDNKKTVECRIQ